MELLACPVTVLRALDEDPAAAAAMVGAAVADDWPSKELADALSIFVRQVETKPETVGWGLWLMLLRDERIVVGDVGFKGPPNAWGQVEIGYGVAPAYRRKGLTREAVGTLIEWGLGQGISAIVAECLEDNIPSIKVLERVGMRRTGKDGPMLKWRLDA